LTGLLMTLLTSLVAFVHVVGGSLATEHVFSIKKIFVLRSCAV
jgi:hypothetical protein